MMRENDVVLTKADKGNTVVLINKIDYVEKVGEFLNGKFKEISDKTEIYQQEVKNIIQHCPKLTDSKN